MNTNVAIFKKYFDSQEEAEEQINNFIDENFDRVRDHDEDKPLKVYIEIGGL